MEEDAPEEVPADCQEDCQHSLWVDEFAPRHYTELLSDNVRLVLAQVCLAFLLPGGGNSGPSQITYHQPTALLEGKAGLWCALLSCRWGN